MDISPGPTQIPNPEAIMTNSANTRALISMSLYEIQPRNGNWSVLESYERPVGYFHDIAVCDQSLSFAFLETGMRIYLPGNDAGGECLRLLSKSAE